MRALQAALMQLPHEHREALILIGAAGVTYEEAAKILTVGQAVEFVLASGAEPDASPSSATASQGPDPE